MSATLNTESGQTAAPADALPLMAAGRGYALLDGVRVIDLTTSIAGPYATMLLADMGVEVVKVERPEVGDDARAWGPPFLDGESLWLASFNRSKKSVALDFSNNEGIDVLHRLVRTADVVIVNFAPRVAKKLKVDVDTERAPRPDLIYVSITGFGLTGERSDWTCYDLIAEGYSGIMDITGKPAASRRRSARRRPTCLRVRTRPSSLSRLYSIASVREKDTSSTSLWWTP